MLYIVNSRFLIKTFTCTKINTLTLSAMLRYICTRSCLYTCLLLLLQAHTSFAITFFEGTFEQAVAKTKNENKKLLIYFTAKWCGPCRYMEKNVFDTDSVTRITHQQFVVFKVDFDAWATKPLIEKYRVASLPTFIIVDSQESVEKRAIGRLYVAELVRFLTPAMVLTAERPVFGLRIDETRYVQRQIEEAKWKFELGIQAGTNLTQVSNLATHQKIGYELGMLLICTKNRLSIRPGLSLMSVGGKPDDRQVLRLQYVALPVTLSYLLRRTVVLGLPGGYRASLTPYLAKPISPDLPVSQVDYGSKIGLSAFVGSTSQLEAQLGYQLGAKDIGWSANQGFYNRGFYLSVVFIL